MASAKGDQKPCTAKLVVAAIDFGTTYSGYAFSVASEPMKIQVPSGWVAGTGALMSLKTPTVLLLKPDKTFHSFGFEAENNYLQLAEDEDYQDYYYFRRFKMLLYDSEGLKRDMVIEDSNKHKLQALIVFAESIKYLKGHLMETINKRINGLTDEDIHWVLTVPAIWSDGSKQFMREAAEMAGIKRTHLDIALEPEAASLFCMHLPVDKMAMQGNVSDTTRVSPFSVGTKYMVVDVGGGTVDITLHEVVCHGKLKELDYANGGEWGGTKVDAAFEGFLVGIIGQDVFDEFKSQHPDDYIDLCREFETKKRSVQGHKTSSKETIRMPHNLFHLYESVTKRKIEDRIQELDGKVGLRGDKLRVDVEIVKSWFGDSCSKIVSHVAKLFKKEKNQDVNTILLVGGFSESSLLQEALRSKFSDKRLIIPDEAGVVVLKGAVMYGHDPLTIVSRVAKHSYGIRVYRDFNPEIHPEENKEKKGKKYKCRDVFGKHITKGQELVIGVAQSKEKYQRLSDDQVSLIFDVFTSEKEDPVLVTDPDCRYIGQLEVDLPDNSKGRKSHVTVSMIFGGTEVRVEAKVEETGEVTNASFDFLQ